MLIRLLGCCIFSIAYTTSVVAAGSQSIIPIPDISNKLRREAGPIVDKVDGEESSSGSRGRFAFKKGKAGFAAFSNSRGRFAFKKGKAGFAAFSNSRGRFAFKKGKAGFAAFSNSRGRFAFKKGKAGFAAFSNSRGRFAFKKGKAGFAAFSNSRGRFAFKKGKAGFAAFSNSRGRFAFKKGKSGFAAFSNSRGRFAFKKGKSGFAAFSNSRGANQTFKDGADQTEASIETPTKIRLPLLIAPLTPQSGAGLSMTDQPNLYWYMSYWWAGDLAFTLNEFGTDEPIIEDSIRRSDCKKYPDEGKDEGKDDLICHLRLADYGVSLEPNKDYEWFVFIVMDPEQRTSDWLSSAFVRYTKPSGQLTNRLNSTPLEQRFSIYKENNFWYDAIDNLAVRIEQQPKSKSDLRKELKGLIEQEKMLNVAEFLFEGCEGCYHELGVE